MSRMLLKSMVLPVSIVSFYVSEWRIHYTELADRPRHALPSIRASLPPARLFGDDLQWSFGPANTYPMSLQPH